MQIKEQRHYWTEPVRLQVFDWEVTIGLLWFPPIRDEFRYMWT